MRMSAEHQRYSIENQAAAIEAYAMRHAMHITRTYMDEGRSGLDAIGRAQFRKLVADVVAGDVDFGAILVLDVSRWGRFQNSDESAYYEYLCTRAGVPVIYCAEGFDNDGSPFSVLLKNLRRAMDGEYSRVLSAKVSIGQMRLARLGYFQGGTPGYGLRRRLVGPEGEDRGLLMRGERKRLQSDRVVLVPGPDAEVSVLRRIFMEYVNGRSHLEIAKGLDADAIPSESGRSWTRGMIRGIVSNERYLGTLSYNRRSAKLKRPQVLNGHSDWVVTKGRFAPLIEPGLFVRAQGALARRAGWSDAMLLQALRDVFARHGRVSAALLRSDSEMPCARTYLDRFGSLPEACLQAGLSLDRDYGYIEGIRQHRALARQLAIDLSQCLQSMGMHVSASGSTSLQVAGLRVRMSALRCNVDARGQQRWRLGPGATRDVDLSVYARIASNSPAPFDFIVLPAESFSKLPASCARSAGRKFDEFQVQQMEQVALRIVALGSWGRANVLSPVKSR
ncbi:MULTISPECIES: recombinase family protein [unclassified Variovorax]|uniref:recombinase family protein n=1 Tax=unclassified Variovorax TaxID=663243 RepID=UPI0008C5BB80|nr:MULTISPECIES: recombinase family protein [unclassified Variovorax]SEK17181.1 Resolvase, N terminal domain [Variovorax sp. OK202]SFE74928.1 Resolvase, N terminal domain [Variovorax sp. OK212]